MVKVKLVAASLCTLLANTLFANISIAATTIDQSTIDAAKANIVEACPVRWEDHSQGLVLPTLASDVIWEDVADRSAFVTYMTALIQELGSTDNPEDIADDVGSVAAECATHRTALLDMLLVKEPNDVVIGMRALKRNLDELANAGKDGESQGTAAKDCKAIKETYPETTDGTYWIDVTAGNSNDAIEVFCDMTTDGGGWTFVSYLSNQMANNVGGFATFFNMPTGTYNTNRLETNEHFSLGILPELNDTEMLVTLDGPNPAGAYQQKRFIRFRYDQHEPMFNFGPMPCVQGHMELSYDIENPTYKFGTSENCTFDLAQWKGAGEYYNLFFTARSSAYGMAIGSAVYNRGGATAAVLYGKDAWFYVR